MVNVTETKELESKITEAHRNLWALNAIATVVGQSLDLDTVLGNALDKTLEIMKVNTGGIDYGSFSQSTAVIPMYGKPLLTWA